MLFNAGAFYLYSVIMKNIKPQGLQAAHRLQQHPRGHLRGSIYKSTSIAGYTLVLLCLLAGQAMAQAPQDYYDTLQRGGIRQVIRGQGKPGAPLLLFLHGGPGSSRMAQADVFSNQLQQHFTVVQ